MISRITERKTLSKYSLFQAVKLSDSSKTIVKIGQSVKIVKPKMAAHIACYSSALTVDLLGELVSEIAEKDLWLHPILCSALIRQVIGQHKEQLKDKKEEIY